MLSTQAALALPKNSVVRTQICRIGPHMAAAQEDVLAVEEPLEIRLGFLRDGRPVHASVAVTMRTPGNDLELALGFLFSEGIIHSVEAIAAMGPCRHAKARANSNIVRFELRPEAAVDLGRTERHFAMSSSCGLCGKASIEALGLARRPRLLGHGPIVLPRLIHELPERLREAQAVFDQTGGLHASALFDDQGSLLCLREDVGRHNALDKLIGAQLLARQVPLSEHILFLSGRVCFELVQKAVAAGITVIAAVGAPSSLAIDLACDCGITVLGFVRGQRFNVYCGSERIGE